MALESEPAIEELSAQNPPKASPKRGKEKKAPRAAQKPGTQRAIRLKDKTPAKMQWGVATSSKKRRLSPDPALAKKARTALTISARRKSLSAPPPKQRKKIIEPLDSPTDEQIDHTPNEGGPRRDNSPRVFYQMNSPPIS